MTAYWAQPPEALFAELQASPRGLGAEEAARRLKTVGPNRLAASEGTNALR